MVVAVDAVRVDTKQDFDGLSPLGSGTEGAQAGVHTVCAGFCENPNPGSDGTTTWNESAASPPNETGSVSGPISLPNSTIEPGHPCVSISGIAPGLADLTWMKWMSSPSISVRNWGKRLSSDSKRRQSELPEHRGFAFRERGQYS